MKKLLSLVVIMFAALGLIACETTQENNQDQTVFDTAYTALNITTGSELNAVISSFNVSTTLRGGVTASWVSNNTAVAEILPIENSTSQVHVKINRPASDAQDAAVKLTATVTYKEITKTKEFSITVSKLPEGIEYTTVAEARSMESGLDVLIKDVVVVGVATGNGYSVTDGTGTIYVYAPGGLALNVGQKGSIAAKTGANFDTPQLTEASFNAESTTTDLLAKTTEIKNLWYPELKNLSSSDALVVEAKKSVEKNHTFEVAAKVMVRTDLTGRDNVYLVDPTTAESAPDTNFLRVYYQTVGYAEIQTFNGLEVKVTVTIHTLRNDRSATPASAVGMYVYEVMIANVQVTSVLTEAQKAGMDQTGLNLQTEFLTAGTVTLPATGAQGSTITYAFKDSAYTNNALVNLTNGNVTLPATGQAKVGVVATITNGATVLTKEFELVIGQPELKTAEEVYSATEVGQTIRIVGTVYAGDNNRTYTIHDASGAALIFTADAGLLTSLGMNTGKTIELTAAKAVNNGQVQLINPVIKSSTVAVFAKHEVTLDGTDFTLATNEVNLGSYITINAMVVISNTTSGSNNTTVVFESASGKRISVYRASFANVSDEDLAHIKGLAVGATYNLKGLVMGAYTNPQLFYTSAAQLEFVSAPETPEVPTPPVGPTVPTGTVTHSFDFAGSTLGNSYSGNANATKTIKNLVDNAELSVVVNRVAANNNHGTHKDFSLIFSGSTASKADNASIIFTFTTGVKAMTFDALFWSAADASNVTSVLVEVLVGETWTLVKDINETLNEALTLTPFTVENLNGATSVRMTVIGGTAQTGNNGARLVVDNLKFYN